MATDCRNCGSALTPGARFCAACGAQVEDAPTEERKVATLLFADVVGSTELGEQDPERTRALLDRFYDAMAAEIARAGGTVEKFAGDSVMAAFGAPAAHEDHAERALHAALAMQRRLAELFGDALRLRIGVNTGEVVVGRAREGSSFVTGDAVNVCARLEQNADPGEILVGERTAQAVRGAFELGEPLKLAAKGKMEGVRCRRLVRALTLTRPRGVGGLRTAFVGREAELELLRATFHRVADTREAHLVTLMGDAGVGKSRIVRELWDWLGAYEPEPVRRTGRCLPYGQGITYWALGEILKEHLGILESDPPETVMATLAGREVLGLALGLDVAGDLHPLAARDRLHDAWVEFLTALAVERPAVVLVEDLHWAEEPLLDLLERIIRDVHGPLFVVGTSRPELLDRRPGWGGGRRNTSLLWLEPLSAEQAGRMLHDLVAADLPDELRRVVVERADGNPFFVEELLASLIDRGVVERRNGSWSAHRLPQDFDVPDSVQGVLASRIDLLPPAEKAALQAAAVIGRIFWAEPVRALIEYDDADLDLLEERDFVRRRHGSTMAGDREFAIKHALTREVAYGSLPKAKRGRLHAAFADWLESRGEGKDELAPLLAHHYAAAVNPDDADLAWASEDARLAHLRAKALTWLRRAAALATGRYEIEDAVRLLRQALELSSDEAERALLWREIGRARALEYDGPAFLEAMEESLKVCHDRRICGETYAELAYQAATRSGMWKRQPEAGVVEGWIDRALEFAEKGTSAETKALLATGYWRPGEAEAEAARALELAERLGDVELRADAWCAHALVAADAGRHEESLEWSLKARDAADEVPDPGFSSDLLWMPVPAFAVLGRFEEARQAAHEYDDASLRLTPHHRVHGVSSLVELGELMEDWAAVHALTDRIREAVAANLDTPCVRNPRSLLVCAAASAELGHERRSKELEDEAESLGMEGYERILNPARIRLALARGDLDALPSLVNYEPIRAYYWFAIDEAAMRMLALVALGNRQRIEREAPDVIRPGTFVEPFGLYALGAAREDAGLLEQAAARFEGLGLHRRAAEARSVLQA